MPIINPLDTNIRSGQIRIFASQPTNIRIRTSRIDGHSGIAIKKSRKFPTIIGTAVIPNRIPGFLPMTRPLQVGACLLSPKFKSFATEAMLLPNGLA